MCVAVVKKPTGVVTDEQIRNCFANNPDGGGWAFLRDGQMVVKKGFFSVDRFLLEYRKDEEAHGKDQNMLLHFRVGTGGTITTDNCHPFLFKHGAFMHNGWFFQVNGPKSDTNQFVEDNGDLFTKEFSEEKHKAIEKFFGVNNKVAILFNDGSYHIFNEKEGHWHNDCWYSNSSHKYGPAPVAASGRPVRHWAEHGYYGAD